MNDTIGVAASQWVYLCRDCGYHVTGDRGEAENAQRIHRHRFQVNGRCGYRALLDNTQGRK